MIKEIEKKEWKKPEVEELSVGKSTEMKHMYGKDGGMSSFSAS